MAARKKKRFRVIRFLFSLIKLGAFILIVLVITYLVSTYVVKRTVVHNVSMQDTLKEGDNLLMEKIAYRLRDPERFEIICFRNEGERDGLIKRVIGLPGETVHIVNGHIFINDRELEDYKDLPAVNDAGLAYYGVTLGADEYFVLGDNRDESVDSRSEKVGNVKREDIIGRAVFRIYPFDKVGILD